LFDNLIIEKKYSALERPKSIANRLDFDFAMIITAKIIE
jgi:hypothetical protein